MKRYIDNTLAGSPLSPVEGVSVRVLISGTQTDASLFTDDAGAIPTDNPVITDARGNYQFCVADGVYDLVFSKAGLSTYTQQGVEIASDLDGGGATTTGMTRADFGDDQTVNSERGLFWKSGNLSGGYGIGRVAGAWAGSLIQLLVSWQAGIQLDPGTASPDKSHVEILNGRGLIAALRSLITGGVTRGAVASSDSILKSISAMADATYVDVCTVTVPNAAHAAMLKLDVIASLGAGGAVGAMEGSRAATFLTPITRTPGLATGGPGGGFTTPGSQDCEVVGGAIPALAAQTTAVVGANNATQTFTVQLRVSRGSGASTNHSCVVKLELINAKASGITLT